MEITTVKAACPAAKKCSGCQLQNLTYAEQLKLKQSTAIRLLGGFCHVGEIIGMEEPYHYRNKASAAFGTTRRGEIISGIYQASTHNIVKVDSCLLEDEKADEVALTVRALLKQFKLTAYDENAGKGFLRHTLIKRSRSTGEMMVVLVTATPMFPSKQHFISALVKAQPEITTIIQNINPRYTSMVLSDRENVLYGNGYIEDILCGMHFRISSKSFYQINPIQTEKLYTTALQYALLTGDSVVIDAYCGTGTIGLLASRTAQTVVGTELEASAVKDARANARLNGAKNISFVCADAGEFMKELAANGEHCDVVFTDPPRAGCSQDFLTALTKLSPNRIVYVSCNPETLARDLLILSKSGYKIKRIQPFDMFPHTKHIEVVTLLVRS